MQNWGLEVRVAKGNDILRDVSNFPKSPLSTTIKKDSTEKEPITKMRVTADHCFTKSSTHSTNVFQSQPALR